MDSFGRLPVPQEDRQGKGTKETSERLSTTKDWVNYLSLMVHESVLGSERYGDFLDNLACSLLYLEYLDRLIAEAQLDEAIRIQCMKTFIITAMGVAESILFYILCAHGALEMHEWKEVFREELPASFPEINQDVQLAYIVRERLWRREPGLSASRFYNMLQKVKREKVLGAESRIYESLDYLRQQRNRVHMHNIHSGQVSDREAFKDKDLDDAKSVLYEMLSSLRPMSADDKVPGFLKRGNTAEE